MEEASISYVPFESSWVGLSQVLMLPSRDVVVLAAGRLLSCPLLYLNPRFRKKPEMDIRDLVHMHHESVR